MSDIIIDAEFKALIPPLAGSERELLEQSIIQDGCRDALVVWEEENILIDGHNRHEICQRNNIDYAVIYHSFDCREAALAWIIENQLGRRNLTEAIRIEMARKLEPIEKELARKRSLANLKQGESPDVPNLAHRESEGRTRDKIAERAGVSHGTLSTASYVLDNAPEFVKDKYRKQELSASRAHKLTKALEGASEKVLFIMDHYGVDNPETVGILDRLEKSAIKPGSNNTFEEILASGVIQTGEENIYIPITGSPKDIEAVLLAKSAVHREVEGEAKAFVLHNTGEFEWYTPQYIIDAVNKVMGDIDLDPATSLKANERVNATYFYTLEENGLDNEWFGRVFLNPPYSSGVIDQFIDKLVEEYQNTEDFAEAIVLVNNGTETQWFQEMLSIASAVCLHKSRIKFIKGDGATTSGPLQGQVLVYIGDAHIEEFIQVFSQYGKCLRVS